MARQYLAVEFKPGGRTYTYHHDGAPLAVGNEVKVRVGKPNRQGYTREQTAKVAALVDEKPPFATKPVIIEVGGSLIDEEPQASAQ